MSEAPPTVTVLMPVFDAAAHLRQAIDSVLAQTFEDFELLVMDDGSTDGSADLVRGYADARIRLERHDRNRGVVATLNAGIARARGRYIARMDADDVCLPTRLEEQVDHLDSHPEIAGVSAAFETVDAAGCPLPIDHGLRRPVGPALVRWSFHFGSFFCHPAAMLRRQIFDSVGGYDPAFPHAEDYDLWLRVVEKHALDNLPRTLLRLRWHGENVSVQHRETQQAGARRALARSLRALLGEDVAETPIRILRDPAPPTCPRDALGAADLLWRLERSFASQVDLTSRERRLIRADAATRLASLAVTTGRRWPRAGARIALAALRMSSRAAIRALVLRLVHKAGVWNRSPLFADVNP
jgi:hypothetical protein